MKCPRLNRPLCLALLAVTGVLVLSYFPLSRIRAANSGATVMPSAGKPLVNLKSAENLKVTYAGASDAVADLLTGKANPTALASADFDADGALDVVAGYSTKNGGALVLLRGNPDAYAPKDTTLYQKAMQGKVPATFLAKARVFSLPESPDLIVTGDFNRDGYKDVLVGAHGSSLYLLAGDGRGNLLAPQLVPLAGQVMALAATGDGHVAVSLDGANGSQLVILAPSAEGLTAGATYTLPDRGDSVAWGSLGGGADIAVGAGSKIVVIYGALSANPQTETVSVPFQVQALTLGDFIWDRDGRTEISVLAGDGTIHILQHGALNTTPLTAADIPGRAALRSKNRNQSKQPTNPTALGAWTVATQLSYTGSAPSGPVSASAFNSPRLAASSTQDLMVLDAGRSQLSILDTSGKTASSSADISFSGTPVAALALPQKIDAGRDIVVLAAGQALPMVVHSNSGGSVTVNTFADTDGQDACTTGTSVTVSNITGTISLRTAVCAVNNSGNGTFTVNVPAGTYNLSLKTGGETGELFVGGTTAANISIIGAGASSTIINQTDGIDRLIETDPNFSGGIPVSISNLTLSGGTCTNYDGSQTPPGDCDQGGGAVIAGGEPNDDLTLTNVVLSNNTIEPSSGSSVGGAVAFYSPILSISNSTFSSNSAPGGGGGGAVYFEIAGNSTSGNVTITNSTFTGNTSSGGGALNLAPQTGSPVTISGSTFTGNQTGSGNFGGAILQEEGDGTVTVSNSRIAGNSATTGSGFAMEDVGPGSVGIVSNNWWGCNAGPGNTGCDSTYADPADSPTLTDTAWLVLGISANPTSLESGQTSALTADLTHNSSNVGGFSVPNGVPVAFGGTLGSDSPTNSTLTSGQATSTYTAGGTTGAGSATAKVDNQTVSVAITIVAPPAITSASSTTFTLGTAGSFPVTTSGSPTPSLSDGGATLPGGVTFHDNGNGTATLSGTPTNTGTFPFTITASNGVSPNATQNFTLYVNKASTSISVSSVSPSSEVYGQDTTVTITAVLSWSGSGPAPTASDVTISGNGPSTYSSTSCGPPSGDTLTCTASYTPSASDTVGSYTESASFSGDSNYTGSSSTQSDNFSITQATSSTSVGSSQNPSVVGQSVTFTATIDGQYGLVVHQNGARSGDGLTSTKSATQRAFNQKQSHPLTAGGITGTVTWSANTGCSPSTVSGNPGTSQCTTTSLPQGTDTITATYSGDSNHSGSTGTLAGGQVVNPSVTGTTIAVTSVSPSSEAYGLDTSVTITAVLSWTGSGPAPTASDVTISGNGPSGYSATTCGAPSGDTLTCTATYTPTAADTVGSYTETASFSGDSNYSASSSTETNNFSITQATSSTSVGSSQNPSVVGQSVTFTATIDGEYGQIERNGKLVGSGLTLTKRALSQAQRVLNQKAHPPVPAGITGTVTWSANTGCSPSTVSGNPGTSQCTTTSLPQGTDTITATYSGDTNHSGSSGSLPGGQVVNPAITGTTIAVTNVSPSSEAYGHDAPVTITAVLSWTGNGPAPTASDVTIGGNGPSGYSSTSCGAPSGDTLTCTATYTPTAADTVGSYTETASFSGDSNYSASSSTQTNNFSITKATSGTSVGSSQNPSMLGQSVTFTATIDGEYGQIVRDGKLIGGGLTLTKRGLSQALKTQRGLNQKQGHPLVPAGITGTVTWSANTGCSPSTVSGDPGTTQCTTSSLPLGNNIITASYSGDSNHSGSNGTLSGGQQVNGAAPTITSANSTTFALGGFNSFSVTTTGNPTPSLSESGTLPNGVGFNDNGNGTGTLSGTPTQSGTFPIKFTASNGVVPNAVQNFTLTVSGATVKVNPTNIAFGTAYLGGEKMKQGVTVTNTGTSPVIVSQVTVTPGPNTGPNDFTVSNYCVAKIGPGKSCSIFVIFTPDDVGSLSGTLNIYDNAAGSPQQVTLSGTVINPVASYNPTSVTFAATQVGHSSMQSVMLTNTGTTALDISSIAAGGKDPGDFQVNGGACPSSLGPTDSCTIDVTFTPTVKGTRSANITVIDNAKTPKQTVPLSGKGQ
jgi:Abnormal spindle-like microcephaly-assoc'd, ASPM-SPD-2-Hydin